MRSNFIGDFDQRKTFKTEYMARNSISNWEYKKHNENNIDYKNSLMAKGKWDQFYPVVSFRQNVQAYELTYFLSYDSHTADLSIDSEFNYEL